MTNSTTTTQNQENPMDPNVNIVDMFNTFLETGGSPKVTEFKRYIDGLITSNIKPLCSGRGKASGGGTGWRNEVKSRFSGRGAKWVKVSLEEIAPTLEGFDLESCIDYRYWIDQAGFAWIRFSGPRIANGKESAAFEVRTSGSTIDHPKQLHYISVEDLDDKITPLNATPHSMRLETETTRMKKDDEVVSDEPVSDVTEAEEAVAMEDEVEVINEAPTSDDPEEWEAFLQAEGLGLEEDDFESEDIYNM